MIKPTNMPNYKSQALRIRCLQVFFGCTKQLRKLSVALLLSLFAVKTHSADLDASWDAQLEQARGQTVTKPVDEADSDSVTPALWPYLDKLHPLLWGKGKSWPPSAETTRQMLDDGELDIGLSFPAVWGEPTVLDVNRRNKADKGLISAVDLGPWVLQAVAGQTLPEPHASWAGALEKAWLERYGK